MTGKQRILDALNYRSTGVPIDFGSTNVTGIHVSVVERLREYFGLPKEPVKVIEPYQMLGLIDEQLRECMKIDAVGVPTMKTMFGFEIGDWKQWRTPWGQEVLVPGGFETTEQDGDIFIYPQSDKSVAPSGKMPSASFFFDSTTRNAPVDDDDLDISHNLEEFGLLAQEELDHYKKAIEKMRGSPYAVSTSLSGTAFGDIALVPGPFLKEPKGLRDITDWYMSTAIRGDYIKAIFEKQSEYAIENLKSLYSVVGNDIDILFMCGTDFGTQTGQFCSIDTYRDLWKPYYKKLNDWIHANTTWKTFKHSCGSVFDLIEEFIDSGFDIINPVQCSAKDMSPKELKARYGGRIVFWGGGIDTQKVLPFGTPEEVRKDVREKCDAFAPSGGFVFTSIHNIQAMVPVENMVAMLEAVWEYRD